MSDTGPYLPWFVVLLCASDVTSRVEQVPTFAKGAVVARTMKKRLEPRQSCVLLELRQALWTAMD